MQTNPKGVTTQMKALDEHFNGDVHIVAEQSSFKKKNFMFNFGQRNKAVKG